MLRLIEQLGAGLTQQHVQSGIELRPGVPEHSQKLNETVTHWMTSLRLDEYLPSLASMATATEDILSMTEEDVKALGMKRLEERRFLQALAELQGAKAK